MRHIVTENKAMIKDVYWMRGADVISNISLEHSEIILLF
jgi:hypothetical protein